MFSKWQIACDERFGINNDAASPLPPFLSSSSPGCGLAHRGCGGNNTSEAVANDELIGAIRALC